MKIGMVLGQSFPPDIRVEKEVRSLVARGHRVVLLCSAGNGQPMGVERASGGFAIVRVADPRTLRPMRRRWDYLRFHATFHHRYWHRQIDAFLRETGVKALHVHDLPLVGTAAVVARARGIPVIADLHENYPATMEIRRAHTKYLLDRIIIRPNRWYAYERRVVHRVDHVLVVVDEARDRLIWRHGLSGDRVTVVMNTEDPSWLSDGPPATDRRKGPFTVCYVGGGGPHRGLETAVRAMGHLKASASAIHLRIVGVGGVQADELRALAQACGVDDRVEVEGWRPFEEVPKEIATASVCIVPHRRSTHTDSTIPHKLFQYMLLGRPVIVSDCRPLARIVTETGAGLVFRADDPQDLSRKIRTLYERDDLRREAGHRGRAAALERYNWDVDGARLCAFYERMEEARRSGQPCS